jgi:hypothetical protein
VLEKIAGLHAFQKRFRIQKIVIDAVFFAGARIASGAVMARAISGRAASNCWEIVVLPLDGAGTRPATAS